MSPVKRILILVGLLAAVGGIGFAIYYVFFREVVTAPPPANVPVNVPIGRLPPAAPGLPPAAVAPGERPPAPSPVARGGLTLAAAVAPSIAREPTLSADGSGISYYDPDSGKFFTATEDGDIVPLSDKSFPNVSDVSWSPTQNSAILEFPDGSNIYFDFATQRQSTLPRHWEDFSFAPDGRQIVGKSVATDPANRYLIVANPDGSGAVPIEPLGNNADKVTPTWSPNNQVVAFSKTGTPIGFGREEILLIGRQGENFKSLTVEGLGFQGTWTRDGQRLVYSAHSAESDYRPELWIVDAAGERIGANRSRLNIQTWADKCTSPSASVLYCAVPRTMPEGAGFDRTVADSVPDLIYRVDLTTGRSTLIAEPDSRASISSIMVSADGRTLFFTERMTGVLRKISL